LDLIRKIKEFTESHREEIRALYDYVVWLHEKDLLAPCILFTYRIWGSTRLSDRMVEITANTIDEDQKMVKICTEVALGLRMRGKYTIENVYLDITVILPNQPIQNIKVQFWCPSKDCLFKLPIKFLMSLLLILNFFVSP